MIRCIRHTLVLGTLAALAGCDSGTEPGGSAAALEIVSGDAQFTMEQGPLAAPLVVRVVDANGRAVPNVSVHWSTQRGLLNVLQPITDADGYSTAEWTLWSPDFAGVFGESLAAARVDGVAAGAEFTGRLLHGPLFRGVSFTPETGKAAEGPLAVAVTVNVATMYRGIGRVRATFQRSGSTERVAADLTLTSGSIMDGAWSGAIVIPHGSAPSEWMLQVVVSTVSEDGNLDGYPQIHLIVEKKLTITSE